MKVVKFILKSLVVLVVLAVVLVLAMPLWVGPVVKPIANASVPKLTKTDFHLGHLSINPYTGRFEIGDLQLANPPNYDEKRAATLDKLSVDLAMSTIMSDTIHVEEIVVDGLFASYVSADGVNNFDQIQYNVAGGKEKYEANKAKAKAEAEAKKPAEEEKESSKRVIIDKLVIKNIRFKYAMLPEIPVPSITLTDLGKKSDGMTMAEFFDNVMQAIIKAAAAVGDGAKILGDLIGDGAGKAIEQLGEGAKVLGDGAAAVGDSAKAVGEGATKAVGAGAKAVGDGAMKAVDSVGAGAKAVGDGAKKAVDSVGDGAKKAADALKSLF